MSADVTPRQRQVLESLLRTRSTEATARELGITRNVVRLHRANAYDRLGVHNAIDAYAALGLIARVGR